MKLSTIPLLIFALIIAIGFIYFLFRIFPIGVAIAIIGGIGSTYSLQHGQGMKIAGTIMSWVYILAIFYSIIFHGLLWGLGALVFGFLGYRYAKR